jgi:hypothetical protein
MQIKISSPAGAHFLIKMGSGVYHSAPEPFHLAPKVVQPARKCSGICAVGAAPIDDASCLY